VDSFIDHLTLNPNHGFCFVNDGSTDDTLKILRSIEEKCKNAFVLDIKINGGKANAVYQGIRYSLGNISSGFYGYMDADLATPLSFVEVMETQLKTHGDIVMLFGSRQLAEPFAIERKAFRHFSGRLVARLITWALGVQFGDTQCGAKIFTKEGVEIGFEKPFTSTWIFDIEIIKRILLLKGKSVIKEIPVNQWKDVGNSKVSPGYFFKMMGELVKVKRIKK